MNCPHCARTDEHRHHSSDDPGYPIPEHCEKTVCVLGWPKDHGRNPKLFSREHIAKAGGHLYLGPCGCSCGPCQAVQRLHVARLQAARGPALNPRLAALGVRIDAYAPLAGAFHFDVPPEKCLTFARELRDRLAIGPDPLTAIALTLIGGSTRWEWPDAQHGLEWAVDDLRAVDEKRS